MKLLIENWRKYVNEVEDFDDFATTQDQIQQSLDYFYLTFLKLKYFLRIFIFWKNCLVKLI